MLLPNYPSFDYRLREHKIGGKSKLSISDHPFNRDIKNTNRIFLDNRS